MPCYSMKMEGPFPLLLCFFVKPGLQNKGKPKQKGPVSARAVTGRANTARSGGGGGGGGGPMVVPIVSSQKQGLDTAYIYIYMCACVRSFDPDGEFEDCTCRCFDCCLF